MTALNHKDLSCCRWCQVTCDPRTYEFRVQRLCTFCYLDLPPPLVIRKDFKS